MVDLAVRARAFADDGGYALQFRFAAEGMGVGRQVLHQLGGVVLNVHPSAEGGVAQKGEHAVAGGVPTVFGDDFGGRLRRQDALAVLAG